MTIDKKLSHMKISKAVARRLQWYVYAYVNPIDDKVFYVGEGHRDRILHHLREGWSKSKDGNDPGYPENRFRTAA